MADDIDFLGDATPSEIAEATGKITMIANSAVRHAMRPMSPHVTAP